MLFGVSSGFQALPGSPFNRQLKETPEMSPRVGICECTHTQVSIKCSVCNLLLPSLLLSGMDGCCMGCASWQGESLPLHQLCWHRIALEANIAISCACVYLAGQALPRQAEMKQCINSPQLPAALLSTGRVEGTERCGAVLPWREVCSGTHAACISSPIYWGCLSFCLSELPLHFSALTIACQNLHFMRIMLSKCWGKKESYILLLLFSSGLHFEI